MEGPITDVRKTRNHGCDACRRRVIDILQFPFNAAGAYSAGSSRAVRLPVVRGMLTQQLRRLKRLPAGGIAVDRGASSAGGVFITT